MHLHINHRMTQIYKLDCKIEMLKHQTFTLIKLMKKMQSKVPKLKTSILQTHIHNAEKKKYPSFLLILFQKIEKNCMIWL